MNDIETRFNLLEAKLSRQEKLIEANKKKKKQSGGYLAFTTGFPEHDDKMFNQAMGTDFPKDEENAKPGKPEDIIPEAGTNPAPEAADVGGVAGEAGAGGSMGGESAGDAGAAAGGEGGAIGESLDESKLTESSWTFEEREFEDGYVLECRWDKYAGYEIVGGYKRGDGIVHDDYHRSYASKEAAMRYFRALCKKHGKEVAVNVNEALLEAHFDPADYWNEDPKWYNHVSPKTKSADWDIIHKARAQARRNGYTTYGTASKADYLKNTSNYTPATEKTDSEKAKEVYKANLKDNKLDVKNFHAAYDEILEKAGYLKLFNAEGILRNKGTYGTIKDLKDFHAKNILMGFWRAQFNGSKIIYGNEAEGPKQESLEESTNIDGENDLYKNINPDKLLVTNTRDSVKNSAFRANPGAKASSKHPQTEDVIKQHKYFTFYQDYNGFNIYRPIKFIRIHKRGESSMAGPFYKDTKVTDYCAYKDNVLVAYDADRDELKSKLDKIVAQQPETNESLTEETKRYVKRYYIRPQNIFCSNKTEILRAFVDLGEENCSVYSLKSLSDHDDVQLLKPSDIIYYYDDGIIYDKNHVKVMDYDLSPKHEEERAKQDVNSVSDAAFAANYDDRLTDIETDSTIKVSENLSEDTIIFEETTCKDGYHIVCRQDKYAGFEVVGGPETQSGEYRDEIHKNFTNKNIALKAYYKIIGEHNASESKGIIEEVNHLGLDFPAITESKLHEDEESCCICGEPINGYGNNAEPYKSGRCCDACNMKFVIPARLAELGYGEE